MTDKIGLKEDICITPADIGFALKTAREAMKISLTDISDQTRISKDYLKYIESGQFDMLPGNSYVKGFLRNYCDVVNVDAEPLIAALKQADESVSKKPEYRFPVQALVPKMATSMLALILVTVALGGYIFWAVAINENTAIVTTAQLEQGEDDEKIVNQFTDISTVSEPPIIAQADIAETPMSLTPASELAPASEVQSAKIATVASLEQQSDIADSASPRQTETVGAPAQIAQNEIQPQTPLATQPEAPAAPSLTEIASNASVPSEPELLNQPQEPLNTASASGAVAQSRIPQRELIITATSAAWLEIARRDGEVLVSKLLRSGETMVTVMDEALLLSTGNAGGLMVKTPTIDNFRLGKVGEIIRDLPLSRDGIKVRYNLTTY